MIFRQIKNVFFKKNSKIFELFCFFPSFLATFYVFCKKKIVNFDSFPPFRFPAKLEYVFCKKII